MPLDRKPAPNDLRAFWMPFTANRQFKAQPRMLVAASDMHYTAADGRAILDGTAGLWCCNAGHCRPRITEAVQAQIGQLDYAPAFQMGHPLAFELANRLVDIAPDGIEHVFYCNSGSEAVDTALKIALAWHRARGDGARTRLIGRERGYHGVGFGGISVGGIVNNRRFFGNLLTGVDHLSHTHLPRNAFTKGQPEHGADLADELERIIALHGAETVAAVIVEPMAGSTGVLLPPKGYLQRLREITRRHGILLIFDEVITGFGRLGSPFAAQHFDVLPDMITCAKGLTNGVVPMGAVLTTAAIHDAFMQGPDHVIELFHGYTYSGNPVSCAAAIATLDTYAEEGLLTRAAELEAHWQEALHALRGLPHVIDIRNMGLIGAVELAPIEGQPGKRGFDAFVKAFEAGILIRVTGDIIAMSPPLIISKDQIDELIDTLADVLKATA
ncbi:MAG: aspartate aminotransferase family protein [Paracoccus sp. (in: a-proteobacteria)]|jgi:beta-alanine--pyruvate transaminase|uniref:aspartate aminotransferase family protein n=3 Tax=Paracoccus TaxID=265 RepID=UPI000C4AF3FE|nr:MULTISPECIES: aspartate aminotransferase family protein [unclassified Paracoccus (in: a-proteobacteria)]MAN56417.1 aspartate aminotransferase family protein [Paracoccus sp. (in: a-proteobacteria)]MAN57270.1 aspartate aminotransferase family protein [Paracoccus sp. (in: a-proteobacteria)]MBA48882.1 aspartate aminotransferase family protein [Paracoccus sp. (in: a-proteobacteria)]MDB2551495.1 aspartate aminotransferase family protein [Paracoccus sp. (in: a-proteobacteria)]|tara:strand:- start:10125 stop:11450 length:1326 start_codon:yes stop_codon:yes gene_type:complete